MKLFIVLALVSVIVADDYSSYSAPSYSAPSYAAHSYSYSAPSYSYSAPIYTKQVLVYPLPHYETVAYAGYTPAGKKGKKAIPVYKTVGKY